MALTYAPVEFREEFQVVLKEKLRLLPDVTVLDFYWIAHSELGGRDQDVYIWDKEQTENADLFIAIVDHPSIGLGMEIMLRHATGKPVLYFAEEGRKVARMLTGLIDMQGTQLHHYTNPDDIVSVVGEYCATMTATDVV